MTHIGDPNTIAGAAAATGNFAFDFANPETMLPHLNWDHVALQGKSVTSYRALVAGGGLFGIGLAWRFLRQLWRLQRGEQPDWVTPVIHLVALMALLTQYQRLVPSTVAFICQLGTIEGQSDSLFHIGQMRMQGLMQHMQNEPHWNILTLNSALLETALSALCCRWLQMWLSAALLALRALQIFLLAVFVQAGPLVLAFSYLGGPFAGFARSWALAIIEVASWSWCLDILTQTFRQTLEEGLRGPFSVPREIVCTLATMVLVLCVPIVASMLLRGATGSAMTAAAVALSQGIVNTASALQSQAVAPAPEASAGRQPPSSPEPSNIGGLQPAQAVTALPATSGTGPAMPPAILPLLPRGDR